MRMAPPTKLMLKKKKGTRLDPGVTTPDRDAFGNIRPLTDEELAEKARADKTFTLIKKDIIDLINKAVYGTENPDERKEEDDRIEKTIIEVTNANFQKVHRSINTIEFGSVNSRENIWSDYIVVDDGADANIVCSATHGLTKKPTATVVVWQNKAANLFKPTAAASADTSTAVFYAFDTASVSAVLLLF